MKREILIAAALGEREPDLVLKNARVVNVFSGEVVPGDIGHRRRDDRRRRQL